MLVILGIAFGIVLSLLFCLAKNAGKKDELEELFKKEKSSVRKEKSTDNQRSWEKDSNWWKAE